MINHKQIQSNSIGKSIANTMKQAACQRQRTAGNIIWCIINLYGGTSGCAVNRTRQNNPIFTKE